MVRDYKACKYCVPLREGKNIYHHQLCLGLKKLNDSEASGRLVPGRMNKGGVNDPPTTPRPKRPKGMG